MPNIRRLQNSQPFGMYSHLSEANVSELANALTPWIQGHYQLAAIDAFDSLVRAFGENWYYQSSGAGAVQRNLYDKVSEAWLSVKDFGAKGDGVADETSFFTAAANQASVEGKKLYIPAGTYLLNDWSIPAGLDVFGAGQTKTTLRNARAPGVADVYVVIMGWNSELSHVRVESSSQTNLPVYMPFTQFAYVHDVTRVGGGQGVFGYGTKNCKVERIKVSGVQDHCVNFEGPGTEYPSVLYSELKGDSTRDGPGMGVQINDALYPHVIGNMIEQACQFGAFFGNSEGGIMSLNTSRNTRLEAFQMADSNRCRIDGNLAIWPETGSLGQDFGISLWAPNHPSQPGRTCDYNAITNNVVINAPKSGISCEGSAGTSNSYTKISGNIVINPNSINEPGTYPAGVSLYGTMVQHTQVTDNFIFSNNGRMPSGVREAQSRFTVIRGNTIVGYTFKRIQREAETVMMFNGERLSERTWTPAVSAQTGAIGSLGTIDCKYYEMERMVYVSINVQIVDAGTGTGALVIPLPFNARAGTIGTMVGRLTQGDGRMCVGQAEASALIVYKFDNSSVIASNTTVHISGWYERD